MSSITHNALPTGTWQLDPVHSQAGFSIKHAAVNTFRGEFKDVAASLEIGDEGSASLVGTVEVASIAVNSEDLKAHLMAPDFFDAEQFPTITFTSRPFSRSGDEIVITGDLTMKGNTRTVEGRAQIVDGAVDLQGNSRLGISIETAINRQEFGVSWQAALPSGGPALSDEVKLTLDLAFVKA